ncbi:cytochrome P450, partial [Flammula alnicola]
LESKAVKGFLQRIISGNPDEFVNHLRHMAGEIILSIAYGIQILPEHDPHIQLSEAGLVAITKAATWGSYAYFPSWLPGMNFKREARKWKQISAEMVGKPLPSIASSSLDAMDNNDVDSRAILRDALGAMYEGDDIYSFKIYFFTVSALSTFILAMVLYPDIQKRGQAEVNRATGSSRLPSFSDDRSIPYVDAILKEVLRWRPVAPLALPHRLVVDDIYKGYLLPAGSVVVGNTWAMLHDKATYGEDVDAFRPERFLRGDELDPNIPHPDPAFGFGRRSCPGQDMAWSSMWLTVASMLSIFDITKAFDENGIQIEPSGEYTSGMQIYPVPFKCVIKLRSSELASLVAEEHTSSFTGT